MDAFLHHVELAAPLFSLVFVGYALMRFSGWPPAMSESLSRFVFSVALPALLFRLMVNSQAMPHVDVRLLIAFFGGCLGVFVIGRLIAWKVFALDGVSQSVFALGGIFSNNVLLGLPLAKVALGDAAVPSVALVLGMGLAEYGIAKGWRISLSICAVKLVVQPFVVWGLARLLDLPVMETRVVVLLSSMAVGVNVYLMSRQFKVLEGPTAGCLVLSTALAALTPPLALTLIGVS